MIEQELKIALIASIERENRAAAALLAIGQLFYSLIDTDRPIEKGVLRACATDMHNLAKSLNDQAAKSIQELKK